MSKTIFIKLTKASPKSGPFTISDELGNILATNVSRKTLIDGVFYTVANSVSYITISSQGYCQKSIVFQVKNITPSQVPNLTFTYSNQSCIWRHLTNIEIYNKFYGSVHPYIIEYPFAYSYNDEILQNVKDYTRAYVYLPNGIGVFDSVNKVEVDDRWFNKAVLYNDQQSSGILTLVPKPKNNLNQYMKYPVYSTEDKTITYTKSDNFYQYNTFWSLVKDKTSPLFTRTCESLSIDKVVNQSNMDYGKRSFKKEPLRAKFLKVRHILDNRSDVHLVSQFIVAPSQISYK